MGKSYLSGAIKQFYPWEFIPFYTRIHFGNAVKEL